MPILLFLCNLLYQNSSYSDELPACRVLNKWRFFGPDAAIAQLYSEYRHGYDGLLLSELHKRLFKDSGPRLLIDGIWLSQSLYGGISRVWIQILQTLSLRGMCTSSSPVYLINCSSFSLNGINIPIISPHYLDPFDYSCFGNLADHNEHLVRHTAADIFCSTWISSSGQFSPSCAEICLVHDCIPERFTPANPLLMPLRRRFFAFSSSAISVSSDTAHDLNTFYTLSPRHRVWCHPSFSNFPSIDFDSTEHISILNHILSSLSLSPHYIVLPGSGCVGSYKNPEIVAQALLHSSTRHLHLLITGINSSVVKESIISDYPDLDGRVFSAGFTDFELSIVFRFSVAVIIPSLVEGFGLPVIEVLKVGGFPIISNTVGLREAGSEAVLRFDPYDASHLLSLLQILIDKDSRHWLSSKMKPRIASRLSRLNPDLLALSLLTQSRISYELQY